MKIFKIYSLYMSVIIACLTLNSCKDYFGDVNIDPNAAVIAPPSALLPTIEARYAYTYWGDFSRYSSIYTQHVQGVDRQFAAYEDYNFVSDDFSSVWSNCYDGILMDIQRLKKDADARGFNRYGGIARALEASTLLLVADFWGDAPYSDAFKLEAGVLQPKYDTQDQLYKTIIALLDEARTKLKDGAGSSIPGSGSDIIYGGSVDKWTKFCNVLSAKVYLRLGKIDAANYAKGATELAKGGFKSSDESAGFQFLDITTGAAPWFQYNDQRADLANNPSYAKLLTGLGDPRGGETSYGAAFDTDNPFWQQNQNVILLGYTEQKFIEAELSFRTSKPADAKTALETAIKASMSEAAITNDSIVKFYLAKPAVNPAVTTLDAIMTQKYIALFTNPEVLNDIRRTGIPALKPNVGNSIPRRFLYPQTEIDLNGNTPKGLTIYSKVGWDK